MKRKLVMLLTIVAVLAVGIGIWYNVPINLMDLEHDEVIEIVVFNGNTGNATHITDETQIEHIIENLNLHVQESIRQSAIQLFSEAFSA